MDRFEFDVSFSPEDLQLLRRVVVKRTSAGHYWPYAIAMAVGLLGAFLALFAGVVRPSNGGLIAVIGSVSFLAGWHACVWSSMRKAMRQRDEAAKIQSQVVIDPDGLRSSGPTWQALMHWPHFGSLDDLPDMLVLWRGKDPVAVIPKRCLASPEDARRLAEFMKARIAA